MGVDGVNAIAVILIASFAVDRTVNGILFLLSFVKPWSRRFPDPDLVKDPMERIVADKKRKLLYFVFGITLAVVVLGYLGDIRLMDYVGFHNTNKYLDMILTGLVVVAGADRVMPLLGMKTPAAASPETASASTPKQIEVIGKLSLEQAEPIPGKMSSAAGA
jgi:cytochrome b561